MRKENSIQKIYCSRWSQAALLIMIIIVLLASNWTVINATNYEISDYAANSLLIQDAKSLSLLTGNYSRIGFNHPGPAILYILAFGELALYDWLNIVKSPFSGQLVAVAFYNGFWIFLIFRLINKVTKSIAATALATSIFLLATALFNYQFFMGIWFPYLYYFPFVILIISASRLINGNVDSLQSLALSSGFLINGHVSFVAIIGIILLIALAFNFFIFRIGNHNKLLLSRPFFIEHKKPIFAFSGIIFLFLVPLLLETIIHFPGPIASYAAFSGGHKANTSLEAIKFLSVYWGGIVPLLMGGGIISLIYCTKFESSEFTENIKSILVIIFSATIALFFYAKYGIDFLEQTYIGFFYYSVPALTLSLAFLSAYQLAKINHKVRLAFIFSLICFFGVYIRINKAPENAYRYNQPEVVNLYKSLSALKTEGRLVLDLDNSNKWETVWENIVGLQAYSKRNKTDLFCINKHWHILFTRPAICTSKEILYNRRLIVRKAVIVKDSEISPDIEGLGLSFYTPPNIIGQGYIGISTKPQLFRYFFLQSGWLSPEKDFVWSEDDESHLSLRLKTGFSGTILLDAGVFLPHNDSKQEVSVYINNSLISKFKFTQQENRRELNIPIENLSAEYLDIMFIIKNPLSPKMAGLSNDSRKLGVALYGFNIHGH